MKRKYYDEGGDVLEALNASAEAQDIAKSMGAGPKNEEAPKAAPKPRVVSKKELEDSGLSLRDYMNKQQGLTRRGSSAGEEKAPKRTSAKESTTDTGDELARLESRYKKPAPRYETPYDRMNRSNRESGTDFDSMVGKLKNRITGASDRGQDRILTGIKKKSDENKFMGSTGMKSGGSVSSASKRADGIATKGKTRGRMC